MIQWVSRKSSERIFFHEKSRLLSLSLPLWPFPAWVVPLAPGASSNFQEVELKELEHQEVVLPAQDGWLILS